MNISNEIEKIKEVNDKNKLDKAKLEVRIEEFTKRREEVLSKIELVGLTPEKLPEEIIKTESEIADLIKKAQDTLGLGVSEGVM